MDFEERIKQLGLELPLAPKPVGAYLPLRIHDSFAFVSGQISRKSNGEIIMGKVGKELTLEEGCVAAKIAALNAIAIIRDNDLTDQIEGVMRLTGYVQTAADFYEISKVIDAASNVLLDIFGDRGKHARSAVGMASLPLNAAVELELTLALKRENR